MQDLELLGARLELVREQHSLRRDSETPDVAAVGLLARFVSLMLRWVVVVVDVAVRCC